jgi:tetratricopeptide (TPR) repeat protein
MSKKIYRKKNAPKLKPEPLPEDEEPFAVDIDEVGQYITDLARFMAQQGFETEEEAKAFLVAFLDSDKPIPIFTPRTPLEKADAVIDQVWDIESSRTRVRLARKALSICKDCADAYVVLGNEARTAEEALKFYEQGVQAGERALGGEEAIAGYEARPWSSILIQPYMRARFYTAKTLVYLDRPKEAMQHLREMLRLSPSDSEGARYRLLPLLLDDGQIAEAETLLAAYDDEDNALWNYTRALVLFVRQGANRKATAVLREALDSNPHVPVYFLGRKRLRLELFEDMEVDEEGEAAVYALEMLHHWLWHEGAIEWLRQEAKRQGIRPFVHD